MKDKTKFQHKHDAVYQYNCPADECNEIHIGETSRRLKERITDHQHRDKNSHVRKHSEQSNHPPAEVHHFKILSENFGNCFKRKISEVIHIKEHKPSLNKQEQSIGLLLFK